MNKKERTNHGTRSATNNQAPNVPDDFPSELLGEFAVLSDVVAGNLGIIARLATSGGGYFGFSITDDGGSCKLAVRHASLSFDRRLYSVVQLETLLAYCLRKLAP